MTSQTEFDERVYNDTHRLLAACEKLFDEPKDALFAGIMSVSVMAHAVEMPLETLLRGISAAYGDLKRVDKEGLQ